MKMKPMLCDETEEEIPGARNFLLRVAPAFATAAATDSIATVDSKWYN